MLASAAAAIGPGTVWYYNGPMEETDAERAKNYLTGLQARGSVPDALYLALIKHSDTPEAAAADTILAFHRDVGNGGLAQAFSNRSHEPVAIYNALDKLEPHVERVSAVLYHAGELYISIVKLLDEEKRAVGDAWTRYRTLLDAAQKEWAALDKKYAAAAYGNVKGEDFLEKAVLAYALANAAAFSTAVKAAQPNK